PRRTEQAELAGSSARSAASKNSPVFEIASVLVRQMRHGAECKVTYLATRRRQREHQALVRALASKTRAVEGSALKKIFVDEIRGNSSDDQCSDANAEIERLTDMAAGRSLALGNLMGGLFVFHTGRPKCKRSVCSSE